MAPAARHVPDAANPAPDSDRPGYPIPGSPAGAENGKSASAAREPRQEKPPGSRTGNAVDQGPGDGKTESRPGSRTKKHPMGPEKTRTRPIFYGAGAAL